MKTLLRVVLYLVGILAFLGLAAFAIGATMPVDHSVSVTDTVAAPPAKVFAIITDIAAGPTWRKEVKSVNVLPRSNGRDVWVEDMGGGMTMHFLAVTTAVPGANGHGVRKVELDDPSYGGTWTYEVNPGPTPNTSTLKITEDGYIKPAFYRFMMAYIFGPTKYLKLYMTELQADVAKS